jgi:hypothetical protein
LSVYFDVMERALRGIAKDPFSAASEVQERLLDDIQHAARELSDGAFKMWIFAMTSKSHSPEDWTTEVFHRQLALPTAKVSRCAKELIDKGYLDRELVNEPGSRGRSSRWIFHTCDEAQGNLRAAMA